MRKAFLTLVTGEWLYPTVYAHMREPGAGSDEAQVAHLAPVGPLTCVSTRVHLEHGRRGESFVTHGAQIGLFPRVLTHVHGHGPPLGKLFVADGTEVLLSCPLVEPDVLVETVEAVVLPAALRAEVRLLACVRSHVHQKHGFGGEGFVTQLTLVGLVLQMRPQVASQLNGPRKLLITEAALAWICLCAISGAFL